MLSGRASECKRLDGLLSEVREGHSATLVVRGEAGIGKSALLDYTVEAVSDFQVWRAGGVESEMELPFAAVHQLAGRVSERIGRLPEPQADALGAAFGLRSGPPPDRFLVGLAVLTLLSVLAEERPLLCVVDDAQWLDVASAQILSFVSRRLEAEAVVLLFGVRDPPGAPELVGLPSLEVKGLSEADARELVGATIPGRLDARVRDRLVADSHGNPLALLELPHGLTAADLAGGFDLSSAMPLVGRIEQSFARRVSPLPAKTRLLMLLAAVEPIGDSALLWRAADRLGITAADAGPAEADGLLRIGDRVAFRHPLVRSVVYRAAPISDRQRAHLALAQATDPKADPDRRAWHRAQAAAQPNEDIASELECSAGRARARGGLAAAAAFLEQAAGLSPDPVRRADRALTAARAKFDAGAPDAALALASVADEGPSDELRSAQVELLRAQVASALRRGNDAPPLLFRAARRLGPLEPLLARETYLEALQAAMFAGRRGGGRGVVEAAEAAEAAPEAPKPPRAVDLLLDGLTVRFTKGYAAAAPTMRDALLAFRSRDAQHDQDMRWLWLACRAAIDLWDDDAWQDLSGLQVQLAREAGALTVLPFALNLRAAFHTSTGEFATAEALIAEAHSITDATGNAAIRYNSPVLAAWRGRAAQTSTLVRGTVQDATARDEGRTITISDYATAVLHNGLGDYETALDAARRASEYDELGLGSAAPIELIEAGARTGNHGLAMTVLDRLTHQTRASGTDWALGIEARSRALLSDGKTAEDMYLASIDHLSRARVKVFLARSHLVYGEWLRRHKRRRDARQELRTALDMFETMGADAFAERARLELVATGETSMKRTVESRTRLTPQEFQVASLAAGGATNPEIASQLFISPKTVDYHLGKVFRKLNITSRRQLARVVLNRT